MSDIRINRAHDVALEDLDVVVVDDSKPMQTIVRSMLNAARVHRVRTFDNAGEAYRSMLVEPPHLLITDWNLPDTDGLSLVRSMRDPRSGPLVSVPVILITGHATRNLVERAIASGIHFVLAKPLSPSNVLKRIDAAIHDDRTFVLDRTRGYFVLQGADELLAGQRQRWRELQEGTLRSATNAAERPAPSDQPARTSPPPAAASAKPSHPASAKPPHPAPVKAAQPAPAPKAARPSRVPPDRRHAAGFGAPTTRRDPSETSTGQASHQAS